MQRDKEEHFEGHPHFSNVVVLCWVAVLLWDNQSVMHYAIKDYDGDLEPRVSTRTTVMGELPIGVDGRRSRPHQDLEWDWAPLQASTLDVVESTGQKYAADGSKL